MVSYRFPPKPRTRMLKNMGVSQNPITWVSGLSHWKFSMAPRESPYFQIIPIKFPTSPEISSKGGFHAGLCHELLPLGVDSHHGGRAASGGRDLFQVPCVGRDMGNLWNMSGKHGENGGKSRGYTVSTVVQYGTFFVPLQFEIAMMSSSIPTSFVDSNFKGQVTRQHQGSQKGNRIAIWTDRWVLIHSHLKHMRTRPAAGSYHFNEALIDYNSWLHPSRLFSKCWLCIISAACFHLLTYNVVDPSSSL